MIIKTTGFTLIELLVVIVIIGIIASISIPNITGYQDRAKNALTINTVGFYVNALARYKATDGEGSYPPGISSTRRCIGEGYPGGVCWEGTTIEDTTINDALRPHLSNLPALPFSVDGTGGNPFLGAIITNNSSVTLDGNPNPFYIDYWLFGRNVDCQHSPIASGTFPTQTTSTTGYYFIQNGNTFCRLMLDPES